ncbi:hypothetical protein N7493_007157 [Penicillium malachiteum]|uniref:Methyltransferase domain-containing protein n=1 Tax=Penicillium malachiteum TaxID=1324776 RepID=A0AAD6HIT1_9EURO|nr:hypothetical protein N7493_007157 [Penicillium malachiteum]
MPRLPTSLLIKAWEENPLLPRLLRECRTLVSARNELRWLRERAQRETPSREWRTRLRAMCRQRSRGVPLQYIIGDQPFGDLEILCERGVLIPRSDTESFTNEAAKTIQGMAKSRNEHSNSKSLRILDLCTGTGCIALLLHQLLSPNFNLKIFGVDISPIALNLAQRNLAHNLEQGYLSEAASTQVQFLRADVLSQGTSELPTVEEILPQLYEHEPKSHEPGSGIETESQLDLLISNPPYISNKDFWNGTTSRSVRRFEPRLALVPPQSTLPDGCNAEDIFYHHILRLSLKYLARVTVLECGDITQARQVVKMHDSMTKSLAQSGEEAKFDVRIWPKTEQECDENGFHLYDGARCVIIRRM